MNPYIYIKGDDALARKALDIVRASPMFAWDSETTGLHPDHPGQKVRLVQLAVPERTFVFDVFFMGLEAREYLAKTLEGENIKLAHNGKFDVKFAKKRLGVFRVRNMVDTMLAAQVDLNDGLSHSYGLEAMAQHYAQIEMDKEEQLSDWARPELFDRQIQYAARDAEVLFPLWAKLEPELIRKGNRYAAQLEFDAVPAVAETELNGITLHTGRWLELCELIKDDWRTVKRELQNMLELPRVGMGQGQLFTGAREINLASPMQIMDALEWRGLYIPIDDKTGRPTTSKHKIMPLALEHPEYAKLLEFRTLQKSLTSYGPNWIEKYICPACGRIHPDFQQLGAFTGRMSCWNPNLQQIPQDKRFRRCFVAGPGNFFVTADYSQFELRILAELSQDPELLRAYLEDRDLHYYSAQLIFQSQEPTDKERSMAKNNNFADTYGAGVTRFAFMAGIDLELAQQIRAAARAAFPRKYRWLDKMAQEAIKYKFSRTMSGRLALYQFDPDDKQQVAEVGRNGRNTPIQGTNADVFKRAMHLLYEKIRGTPIMIVHLIHDAFMLESPGAWVAQSEKWLTEAMLDAAHEFLKIVPVKVDVQITKAWLK